jgi:hypothetical protein
MNEYRFQEEFIRHFVKLGHGRAQYYNRNMVRYDDMGSFPYFCCINNEFTPYSPAAVVQNRYDFNFLRGGHGYLHSLKFF